jgi:adenylate cyclase
VLPFKNMSSDPEQEYFSDGLTEVLTSDLSKLSSLFVISRNSAFTYKGKPVKAQEVSKELGVQYVLEGSVLKAGDQLRITAQLIDATQDHHLWAERYDRPLKDIFTLQDEIVQKIVTTLRLQLTAWEQGYLVRKRTDNLDAYDSLLRGAEYFGRALKETKKEANLQAQQMYEKAIELDSTYAEAYAYLGWSYWLDRYLGWSSNPAQTLERELELAQKAIALDDSLAAAYRLLGQVYLARKQHEQAIAEVKRAIAFDPNWTNAYMELGAILAFAGRPEEGIEFIETARRLNPREPLLYHNALGFAYLLAEHYEHAIAPLKKAIAFSSNYLPAHVNLAICYAELGREEEAQAEAAEILRLSPNFSVEVLRRMIPAKDPAIVERYLTTLRKAGLK